MDLNELLQRIPEDRFERIAVETDVDPEDEVTFGWSALVLLKDDDGGTFIGRYDTTPLKALEGLIEDLIKQGYLERLEIYGR